ncbi:hypothetical protein NMG60_11015925 [Bertholletia excelsa]
MAEEMDSLFEGMVLISPSHMADVDHVHQQLQQEQHHQSALAPSSSSSSSSSSENILLGASLSPSEPLDENLFSDLTLITSLRDQSSLQVQSPPNASFAAAATTTTDNRPATPRTTTTREVVPSSLCRQVSVRKKKRAGLRIGYGRDAPIPDDHPSHPHDPEPTSLPADGGSLSFSIAESESCGSASAPQRYEQPQQLSSSCSVPGSQTTPISFPHVQVISHLSPCTATTTVEPSLSVEVVDHSNSITPNSVSGVGDSGDNNDNDNFVSGAQPMGFSTDLQTGSNQVSTATPIELRFEHIRDQISQKLGQVRELVASVTVERKDSIRRRRKASEALDFASTRYRELEKNLEEACEAEDFETAERVSESLASAEKDKERLSIDLRRAETDCDAVDSMLQQVLEGQIAAEEECAFLLKSFAIDAENDADQVQKNAELTSEKELERWLSLTEEIELKKMEIDIESHLVNAARLVLSDSIENSIKNDRRERELLVKKKQMLTEELIKLLALVKEKETEITETDHKIVIVEKRIAEVVSSFQEGKSILDVKYENLQSGLSQIELDNEALTRKEKEIDDLIFQEKSRGMKLRELAQISADEANMYQEVVEHRKSLALLILKAREDKVMLANTEEQLSKDVHSLKQEISAARATLQEISSTKTSFQQEIESLKQRLVFIDKRVPELESEKKVAAAARNFKEAARIAAESKTLNLEKEGLQVKMEEVILKLGKLEEEICNTVNRLQETEGQISTKEKEVAIARFQRLLLIAGAGKAERLAALELGDTEEADTLLAEAEAAESEARKIQPVYGLREEEFANLPKRYISMELVSNLGGKQLAELAASSHVAT